jgi:hypothetical protein
MPQTVDRVRTGQAARQPENGNIIALAKMMNFRHWPPEFVPAARK